MTQCDFDDMKKRYLEHLENDSLAKVVYRALDPSTLTNARFGFVVDEQVTEFELNANVVVTPSNKVKAIHGVSADCNLIVLLATKQLEDYELEIQREQAVIQYGSQEFEILGIHPKPLLFNSSVITVLGCKLKEPLVA